MKMLQEQGRVAEDQELYQELKMLQEQGLIADDEAFNQEFQMLREQDILADDEGLNQELAMLQEQGAIGNMDALNKAKLQQIQMNKKYIRGNLGVPNIPMTTGPAPGDYPVRPKIEVQPTTRIGNTAKDLKGSLYGELGLEEDQ